MASERHPELAWTITEKEQPTDHRVFSIYHQKATHPSVEKEQKFVVIDCPSWINVIALTPEKEVVLIRQFRHGTSTVTLEIPGGMVDAGEEPLLAAQRELEEETGYRASRWIEIGTTEPNPALQNNVCWTYLALDATYSSQTQFDSGEVIQTELQPLSSIPSLIASGEITHALVVVAFYHLLAHENRINAWS